MPPSTQFEHIAQWCCWQTLNLTTSWQAPTVKLHCQCGSPHIDESIYHPIMQWPPKPPTVQPNIWDSVMTSNIFPSVHLALFHCRNPSAQLGHSKAPHRQFFCELRLAQKHHQWKRGQSSSDFYRKPINDAMFEEIQCTHKCIKFAILPNMKLSNHIKRLRNVSTSFCDMLHMIDAATSYIWQLLRMIRKWLPQVLIGNERQLRPSWMVRLFCQERVCEGVSPHGHSHPLVRRHLSLLASC